MVKRFFLILFFPLIITSCGENGNNSTATKKNKDEGEIFNLHLAEHTNISFSNNVYETTEENYLNYEFLYNGSGVAVGDINNDGLPDIYFAGNSVPDRLYLNKGDFKFQDISTTAGINILDGWSTGVNMVDINQDGLLDIYVCRSGPSPDINRRINRLYINQGNATFKEEANKYGIASENYSIQSAFFDYDLDGDLDLYLLNHPDPAFKPKKSLEHMADINSGAIRTDFFYENIDGKFVDKTFDAKLYNFGFRHGIAVGDVNKDGYPDLYVSSDFEEPDALYINNGNKTFTNKINESMGHISFNSMGNELTDVNNDGDLDLFVVDMAPDDHYRSKLYMASMDVSRFRSLKEGGYHSQYMFNTLQLNNSDGTFSEVAQYSGLAKSDWSWAPLFFDMDLDGYKDLFITNGIKENFSYRDLNKDVQIATNGTGQIDIQGLLKLVPSEVTENQLYRNIDGVKFEKQTKNWVPSAKFNSNGIATGDFDNDGDLDFVTNNMVAGATIYESLAADKELGNYIKINLKGKPGNLNAVGARLELKSEQNMQYNELHRAKGYLSAVDLATVFGLSDETTADLYITWPDNKVSVHRNLKANETYEFDYSNVTFEGRTIAANEPILQYVKESGIDFKHQEDSYDDYAKQILLPHSQSNVGPATASADVNGDGLTDFFVGGAASQSSALYIQNVDGTFSKSTSGLEKDKKYEDTGAVFFDSDQDGDLDLYVVSGGAHQTEFHPFYEDRLYINNGTGAFTRANNSLPKNLKVSGQAIASSDIDGDGDIDLFVGGRIVPEHYPKAPESYFLINEGGKFIKKELDINYQISSALFTDTDGDGDEDLVIAGEWSAIMIFKNSAGDFEKDLGSGLSATSGLWFSLVEKDIDGDGDMDLFAGNLGLNAKFKSNAKKDFEIYCADFDNNSTYDVVLSTNYRGQAVPTRGRECSSQQMPFIAEKFGDYHSFASASMTDIYGEALETALHHKADILYSVFLENKGSGKFEVNKLPWECQLSPIQDFDFIDIDKDGTLEVVSVGNLYNVEVETVRYDASRGVILKYENGSFKAIPMKESGFYTSGDARYLEVMKTQDGDDNILVTNNNGVVDYFKLQ